MNSFNEIYTHIIERLYGKIEHVVFTASVSNHPLVKAIKERFCCFETDDARGALYIASGIYSDKPNPIMVICSNNNESRSAASGLTECFYRQFPILFVTLTTNMNLNYSIEIKDTIEKSFVVFESGSIGCAEETINKCLREISNGLLPVHLQIVSEKTPALISNYENDNLSLIINFATQIFNSDDYLFLSNKVYIDESLLKCDIHRNDKTLGDDGTISTIIGASLGKKKKRYFGIITSTELIHDFNALGNVNVGDDLFIIIIDYRNNLGIKEYAYNLGFKLETIIDFLDNVTEQRKGPLFIY